jgi:hypothetical protein
VSKIATGVRFTDRQSNKGYGYLAIFSDGDVRRHTTNFKKTHCVRVRLASHYRWQHYPIIPGAETCDGMQKHFFHHDHCLYEWFTNEEEAVREVKKAASMKLGPFLGETYNGRIHPLNRQWADDPYYSEIEIVQPRVVWATPDTTESLASLNDPRIKVSTPAMVAHALAALAATYQSDFQPEAVR